MSQRFYAWSDPRDAAVVADLEAAARERETPLVRFDPAAPMPAEPVALVIFLSAHLLESAGEDLPSVVDSWSGPVVPVALTSDLKGAPRALRVRSWIEVEAEPPRAVGGRIALSVRTSPGWLLAWQELSATAAREGADGSPVLLGRGELERADATIRTRPRDLLPTVPSSVLGLTRESRHALERRRRRQILIGLTTVLALLAVALIALLQRHSATVAEAHAKQAATRSRAQQLSRLARQDVGNDPDLPILLARRAYRLEPGPETRESLREALDVAPWHRSYRLPVTPSSLATSPGVPFVVVVGDNGSVILVDSRTGRRIGEVPRPAGIRGIPVVAASADGRLLAVAYNGGLVQLREFHRGLHLDRSLQLPGLADSESKSIAWLPRDRLLIGWSSRPAMLLDSALGRSRRIRDGGIGASLAVAVSPGGRLVALAGRRRIVILRSATMRPCWSASKGSPGSISLLFDMHSRTLFAARSSAPALQLPIPRRCGVQPGRRPETEALIWTQSPDATALPGGGIAVGDETGRLFLLDPPATYPAGSFLAHISPVTGVGVVAGGALVTAGADRWLRIWHSQSMPAYPLGPAWNVSFNEQFGQSSTRATWRSMIASDEDGSTVTVGGLSSGSLAVMRANRLDHPLYSFFLAIDSSIHPLGGPPCGGMLFNGQAIVYRCVHGRLRPVWNHGFTDGAQGVFNATISEDGRAVAAAGLEDLYSISVSDGHHRRFHDPDLRSLLFDDSDKLFAVSGDGSIVETELGGDSRTVAASLGGRRIVAAGVVPSGQRLLIVCADGEALLVDTANGRVEARFRIGADLDEVIDVRFSRDGRLAVVVSPHGYRVVDIEKQQVIATGDEFQERELGAEPRDATFLGSKRSLVLIRADEGLTRFDLAPWRFLDGRRLLRATAGAVPRRLENREIQQAMSEAASR
jgi:hypothetical protein